MEAFIISLLLFLVGCVCVAVYKGVTIGNRAHKSIEKWIKSKPE